MKHIYHVTAFSESEGAPKTLWHCEIGDTVLTAGGERYVGAFVGLDGKPDPMKHYAVLWPSKERFQSGEMWHSLAASRSHRVEAAL